MPPRRIRFHSLAQARAAVAAGAGVLESPPGAAAYWGPGLFLQMLAQAGAEGVLDCGDAPGRALAALRAGVKAVRLRAAPEVLAAVAEIAASAGARLETEPAELLDLAGVAPKHWDAACRAWLTRPD